MKKRESPTSPSPTVPPGTASASRWISIPVAAVLLLFWFGGTSASAPVPTARVGEDGEFFRKGPLQFFPGGEFVNELMLVDFDDDGDLDLLATQFTTPPGGPVERHPVIMMVNDGEGTFSPAPRRMVPRFEIIDARDHAVADFDGDGRQDVLLGSQGTDQLVQPEPGERSRLLLRKRRGGFKDARKRFPGGKEVIHSLAEGDLDGDGDLDIYMGHLNWCPHCTDGGLLYLNNGRGRFSATAAGLPWEELGPHLGFTAVEALDADGDGDLDLLLGPQDSADDPRFQYARDILLLNDGTGSFAAAPAKRLPKRPAFVDGFGWQPSPFETADLNCDGADDAIVGYDHMDLETSIGGVFRVWINKKGRRFKDVTRKWLGPLATYATHWIRDADFNGDGWPDLLVFNADSPHGTLLLINRGGRRFLDGRPAHPAFEVGRPQTHGDVDGDGDIDIVAIEIHGDGDPNWKSFFVLENVAPYKPSKKRCDL